MKIGVLTYHYSTNYGGVLQCYSLYDYLMKCGYDVEVINFIPDNYNTRVLSNIGFKSIFNNGISFGDIRSLIQRVIIKLKYSKNLSNNFNLFREQNMKLSSRVNENQLESILKNYDFVIVGSDQIWGPGQRSLPHYFLGYQIETLKKISYAADSTISDVEDQYIEKLRAEIIDFKAISVRNQHSYDFVKRISDIEPKIVADPTLLIDFDNFKHSLDNKLSDKEYILIYTLGGELNGSNKKAIEKIKKEYGEIHVYSIINLDRKFSPCDYCDRVFYDINPEQWVSLFYNAKFIFTDSYHGTLFAIKYEKPFLAYYVEEIRRTRFDDIASRYKIDSFIVSNIEDIDKKGSLKKYPEFNRIHEIIEEQRTLSRQFLNDELNSY